MDKEGVIELIINDTRVDAQNELVTNADDYEMEEDFNEALYDELQKMNVRSLLDFYVNNRYK